MKKNLKLFEYCQNKKVLNKLPAKVALQEKFPVHPRDCAAADPMLTNAPQRQSGWHNLWLAAGKDFFLQFVRIFKPRIL